MFPEVLVEKRSISAALNICPDFRLTRMGPFVKNKFTDWADTRLLNYPDLEKGLTVHNYQHWLNWSYRILAKTDKHDPVLEYTKNLMDATDGVFKVLWLLPFQEKGFDISDEVSTGSGLMLRNAHVDGLSYERELIRNRFGQPVLIERAYDKSRILTDIYMLYRDEKERIILRFDDPEKWSFQFDQQFAVFLVGGPEHEIKDWVRKDSPLPKSAIDWRFARSMYTGEIVKGR